MTQRGHIVLSTVLVLTGLLMVRLSTVEIQPWDEGLYAVRGESIATFDAWFDQTPHTIGGLYSSTPPPLVPWAIAAGIDTLGNTPIAVRWFSIICSGIALLMTYLIARRILTFENAIMSMVVLIGTLPWVVFSRQGMTEVPLVTMFLVCLWAVLKIVDGRPWGALVFGVSFGLALLTKMTISFIPLLFLVVAAIVHRQQRQSIAGRLMFAAVLGLVIAAPWYVHMTLQHGVEFVRALIPLHALVPVEGNASALGPLYYVNQLIVGHPLINALFAYCLFAAFHRALLPRREHLAAILVGTWFVVAFFVMGASATKNYHYVVILVPPAVLGTLYALERLLLFDRKRFIVAAYGAVISALLWAFVPFFRGSFTTMLSDARGITVLAAMVGFIVLPWVLPNRILDRIALAGFRPLLIAASACMVLRSASVIVRGTDGQIKGGREVSAVLLDGSAHHIDYVYHKYNDGDVYNPQLAWYLHGWMSGWDSTRTYLPWPMPPENETSLDEVFRIAGQLRNSYVVYYHPNDRRFVEAISISLDANYSVVSLDRRSHYTLYRRRAIRTAP